MILNFFKNPFLLYASAFCIVIFLYLLGFSEVFPDLSLDLILFILTTILVSITIGLWIQKKKPLQYFKVTGKNTRSILIIIYIFYAISFIYNNGIPLILILSKASFFYKSYGIPFFQPIINTFTSFYTVYLFHVYISNKNKNNLINLVLILCIPLLIYSRGMLIISLVNFIIIYFISQNKIKIKTYFFLLFTALFVFYSFGVLGNIRDTSSTSKDNLFDLAKPTKSFIEGPIPKEYFWSYVYAASPMANFQKTVNNNPKINNKWQGFITQELLPDFLSKRINNYFKIKKVTSNKISPNLTASTIYANSYKYLGWLGPTLIFLYLMSIAVLYWLVIKPDNPFYITSISILGAFIAFNVFSNMINFSGLSLQLLYPLLFQLIYKKL